MSNGQSSSGGIGGGLIPEDGFLGGSLLEEADLLGALPGLTDIIGAGGSQAPSGSGFPDPSLLGLQSPSPLQPPAFPIIPSSGGAGSSSGSSGSPPSQFNSLFSDALTGATQGSLVGNPGVGNFPLFSASASGASNATAPGLGFTVKAEGTVTINSNSDFDGDPLDLSDDALIYAGDGFTINGNPVLPVQLDEFGQPVLDNSGRPLLVDNAVAVSADYSIFNANNNSYGNLVPPQIVEEQIVEVPDFNTLKTDTLAAQIPDGTVPISFNPYQNPLNNATDWANHFPPGGTAEQPTVVKVTGWGLNVPGDVTIENTIIELTNGYLNFNGNGHQLNNVTFVTHNGGMNLGNIQGTDVTLLSSQGINMNGGARLGGQSLIATGDNQSIQFNGATETTDPTDFLTVISQRDITFNSSANTRGSFLSRGNFSINSTSTIYGSIEAKGNVVFNARATVIGIAPTGPSNTAPTDLALSNTTLPENGATNSVVGQFTTTDPDAGDTFTYTLVPGTGDADNAAFSIVNDQLQINASPNFEAQDSYAIRVQSTDQGGLSVEKVFTVNITDVNEQPTQITLSQSAVEENSATGTVVGQLSSLDPDQGDSHTYELVDDAGGRFQIVGDQLQVADGTLIDFETATEYSLTLRSTDAGGLSTTQGLTIQVLDVDDDLQITAALLQDTGATNTDGITADGTIQGTINYPDNVASLKAGLDNTLPIDYEDITPLIQADGSFTLDEAQLSSILGVPLTDGDHILYLQAVDAQGNSTDIVELAFTLDRTRPTVDLLTPLVAGEHSPTARLLGDAQDSVAGVDQIRYDLNGQGFVDITADSTGAFDALLAQAGLAAGAHQLTVEVTDFAGNVTQTQLDFQVNPDLLVGPTASQGWVARSGDAVVLGEQNSFVSEASLAVELGQDTGSRTLSFDLNAVFDGTDAESLPDQVLVYLVDANDPSQTLLDQGVDGTPVFALGEQGAEFQAGLVRFNGSTVEIDVTSVTTTQGLLVFQLINGDSDTGSVIQVSNLTNEVDESGVASPVFPMRRDVAQAGATLDLGGLTESTDLDVVLSKVSLDTDTGRYVADLQIENTGAAIGRQVAVVFDSLPDGVTLLNASGTDSNGNPYINLNLAIRPGGLLEGGISDAVQVVFDNPNLLNLDLQPQVLVGGVNQAPVLEAITVPQLMPGEVLKLPLQAADPDGDPITYSLRSEGALPIGILRGDGTLEFRPAPDQIGTYTFTIVASDGALETTQEVTLEVVADPITTTRISGVIANVDQQPLAGVRVEVAGVEGTTAADGSFTLEFVGDLPGDTLKIYPDDINTATEVYPFIAEKLPLVLGHDPYGGVNNVIDRPIYLPVLDIANGQVIDPTQDTTVTTATIPGAAVTVAAGSLLDQQGNPFDGVLSITEVPAEFTPAALPPNLSPDLVVTIQPGEMVFDTPAPLSLPNLAGFEPGELMDLWSINPETGDFDNVGVGQVSADGTVVETIEGGIRSSSWHFFAIRRNGSLLDPDGNARNRDPRCIECTDTQGLTSMVESHTGALVETHDLVSYQSLGANRGVTLTYDSLRADARPIIHFGLNNVRGGATQHLIAKLTVRNGEFAYQVPGYQGNEFGLTGGEHIWSVPGRGDIDAALQADLRSFESGIYTYDLMSGVRNFNGSTFAGASANSQGQIYHINSIDSVFGSGWGIAGLQEIVESPSGSLLLVDGDGTELIFSAPNAAGEAYQSPPGDYSTLVRLADGTFERTMKDQTVYRFNDQNQLISMTDRNGNVTAYEYNANAQISKITDPVGLETNFTYTGNRVTQITDPAGKVTQLDYDAEGNLLTITDPDGQSRNWSYDADHRMTGEVDKRGNQEFSYYDFAGRVTQGIRKDGSVVQVAPVAVQGLYRPELTTNPLAAPEVFTLGAVESAYADGNGNITLSTLDQAGQAVFRLDGEGNQGAVDRNSDNLVTQSTDGRGHEVNLTYDAQGNVIAREEQLPAEASSPYLFPDPSYIVDENPQDVELADLNGDGQLDLITANTDGRSISLRLGNADGTFQGLQEINIGFNRPQSIQTVDLNNDGNLDFVTTNTANDSVSVLLGNGDGSFNPHTDYTVTARPTYSVLGDFNSDGQVDLLTLHESSDTTNIMFGDGNGGFSAPLQSSLTSGLQDPTLVDLNADGRLDLVASNTVNNSIALFLGNGDGTFTLGTEYSLPNQPLELEIADVDGNGITDIIANSSSAMFTLFGNGDGTFDSTVITTPLSTRMNFLQVADLNQDGFVDLVGVDTNNRQLTILDGDGTGQFSTRRSYATKDGPSRLALGDLNGDSVLDVVTVNPATASFFSESDLGSAYIYLGNGDGTLDVTNSASFSAGLRPTAIASGDFNQDGRMDFVTANSAGDNVTLQFGQANGGFGSRLNLSVGEAPNFVAAQDLNKDGFLDILTTNESSNTISVLLGTGAGSFAANTEYAVGRDPSSLTIADFNGDSELDLLVANSNDPLGTVLLGQGDGTFIPQVQSYAVGNNPQALVKGDFNGDSLTDLVVSNRFGNSLSVLLAQSQGGYAAAFEVDLDSGPISVASAELNGDGQLDILVAKNNGQVSALLGQGDGTFNLDADYSVGQGVQAIETADFNGDGFVDFVTANRNNGTVTTYFGLGDGRFTNAQSYTVSRSPQYMSLADLDGDGTLDITTVDSFNTQATTLWGNSDGSFSTVSPIYAVQRGGVSDLGDINGDGFLDLVTTSPFGDDRVSVLLGTSEGTFNPQLTEFVLGEGAVDLALVDVNGDNTLDIVSLHSLYDPNNGGGGGADFAAASVQTFNAPVANSVSSDEVSISIMLGNGDGSFAAVNSLGTGILPTSGRDQEQLRLTIGDVDNDGQIDLLTTDTESSSIALFLGNGDGSFGSRLNVSTSSAPTSLVAGDLNGDGQLDLISANGPSNGGGGQTAFTAFSVSSNDTSSFSILMGNGDGTFTTTAELETNRTPNTIQLADLNGDGQLDLLSGNGFDETLSVWLGNGDGSFQDVTSYEVQRPTDRLTLGDVNQDGALDVLVHSGGYFSGNTEPFYFPDADVTLILGRGDGTFAATVATGTPNPPGGPQVATTFSASQVNAPIPILGIDAESLHLVDMDQDGILDLVNTNSLRNLASIYRGNGDGSFATGSFSIGDNPRTFALGDVNGDGIIDSISGNAQGPDRAVTVQFGNGDGSFAPATDYVLSSSPADIQIEDVNGDAVVDIVTANSDSVSVLLGNGNGTFADPLVFNVGGRPSSLVLEDTNQDGFIDIITANADGDSVSVLLGNGDGTFIDAPGIDRSKIVVSGDLNQDGVTDVVALGASSTVLLGAGNGTFPSTNQLDLGLSEVSDATLVDINYDNFLDLVVSWESTDQVGLLLGNGDGTFGPVQSYAVGDGPVAVAVGDINLDGTFDILAADANKDSVSVLLGNRDGSFADATQYLVGLNPLDFVLDDFDQDGDLDFVAISFRNNRASLHLNRTLESVAQRTVSVEQTYTYDPVFNQLTSSVDELGRQTFYEIDPNNGNLLTLTRVVGDVGGGDDQITQFTYTNQGLVDLVTDPLGRITDFDYNNLGLLTQMTIAQGTVDEAVMRYEYDTAGNQTAMTDENGNRTEYAYDALNRLTQIIEADPDGAGPLTSPITTFTYDEYGNVIAVTDARGNTTQSVYDERDRLVQVTDALNGQTTFEYDTAGNLVALTDELGHTTEYRYDSRNRQVGIIDPEGFLTQYRYDANNNLTKVIDPLANETSFAYDVRNRRIRQTDALGRVTQYGYDAVDNLVSLVDRNGNATTYAYDDLDRLISSTDALDGVSTTTYDVIGNVIAVTDELGRTTQFDYDNRDRLTQITDPLDGVTTFAYDGVGNLLSVTDELNRTTTYEYDALNRQISVSDPLNHTTTFGYDAVDNLVSVTDALGRVTQYEYDALNRESTRINALGDTHSYTYDAADNVVAVTDELGRTTTFTYDDRDLRTSVTDALGHTTTTEYDGVGNVTAVIDALGHTTRYGYDALYRQTSDTDAIGQTTTYAYDPVGNLLRITDPENNSTTYTYDALYRQVTDTNELGDTRRYSYDAVDNLIGMTDRNGRQFEYTYDDLDRQMEGIWLDATGNPIRTFSYTYDAADQLTAVSDPYSAYTYTYDLAGRLITVDNAGTPGVPNVLLTYTYDAVNNMLTVTDTIEGQESGLEAYTYDALDRVIRLTQSGNGVAEKRVDFAYDVASQMTGSTRFADLAGTQLVAQSDYTFDLAGRLTNLTHSRDSVVIADYRWDYDAANRIIRFTSPDGTSDYNYDDRNQITRSDHSYQDDEAYSYDNNGNRTNPGYETGGNNRLLSDGTYTYTYDGEGNRITRTEIATGEVTEYTWDYRNRLTDVVTKDSTGNVIQDVEYGYDVYDRRIEKTVDPDGDGPESEWTERFVYDGDHIALVFDENGEQTHRYLHGPQIDQVLSEEIANGEVRWALADNQGTVRDVIDSEGNLLNHITYDSFGKITSETNPEIDFRFSYTGREFDEETGQYYYRARYYDASVGRFISEDPIGFSAGDANLNRYVFNSPIIFTDPSGNAAIIIPLIIKAAAPPLIKFLAPKIAFASTLAVGAVVKHHVDSSSNNIDTGRHPDLESNSINRGRDIASEVARGILEKTQNTAHHRIDNKDLGSHTLEGIRSLIQKWADIPGFDLDAARDLIQNCFASGLAAPGIDQLFNQGITPTASSIQSLAEQQGFIKTQNPNGPIKFIDENGIVRITIKKGTQRAPGSGGPHVELRNAAGQRVDPSGNPVTRKSPGNHTPINHDL
ncbi:FG-GAP-like repeat-containing protein [Acaryochloris marina NIES-2412]|uniref:FG-GAP-like repeat-containing protein n=1 Tax=Acaryochloris marina TaxID=155978 RepID=UPI004058CC43